MLLSSSFNSNNGGDTDKNCGDSECKDAPAHSSETGFDSADVVILEPNGLNTTITTASTCNIVAPGGESQKMTVSPSNLDFSSSFNSDLDEYGAEITGPSLEWIRKLTGR